MDHDPLMFHPDDMSDPKRLAAGLNKVVRAAMQAGAEQLCQQMGYAPPAPGAQVQQLSTATAIARPATPTNGGGNPGAVVGRPASGGPGYGTVPGGRPGYGHGYGTVPGQACKPAPTPECESPYDHGYHHFDHCPPINQVCPPELEWVRPYLLFCERFITPSALARAIELYSWPVIEDELRRGDVNLDVIVTGVPGFKNNFPLNAGEKIRIRQQDGITLPFWPGMVDVAFSWRAADPPQPDRLTLRWQTGRRDTPSVLHDWIRDHFQKGSLFQCGDDCKTQPFPTRRHCGGGPIGMLSYLYVDIEAANTMTSVLEGVDITIHYDEQAAKRCGC